jgi:integrase
LRELRAHQTVKHIGGEDFVFRAERGGAWIPNDLSNRFREAVDGCEAIPKEKRALICFHSLRHSFASWLTMRDVHPRIIQESRARSTRTLTARYAHLRPGAMDEAIGAIGNVLRRPRRAKGATRGPKPVPAPSDPEGRTAVSR